MMPNGRPRFDVIEPTTSADERRWVATDVIRALTGFPTSGVGAVSDETLNLLIDGVLAQCATSCRLAASRGSPPTLARETVLATWLPSCWDFPIYYRRGYCEPSQLFLPWRAPITSIVVTDGGTELVENTDYQLLGAGVVQRLNGAFWPTVGSLAIEYVAGFLPDDDENPPPDDLVALIADQVRMNRSRSAVDLNLRSEDIPGVWSGTYNVPGGDAVDTSGLNRPLYDALSPYRAPPSIG